MTVAQRRAEMLRDLAHELRTPLTSVRGYREAMILAGLDLHGPAEGDFTEAGGERDPLLERESGARGDPGRLEQVI